MKINKRWFWRLGHPRLERVQLDEQHHGGSRRRRRGRRRGRRSDRLGIGTHAGAGAAIGARASTPVTGGLIGNSQDNAEARQKKAVADYAAAHPPVSINDVVQMTQSHVADQLIINRNPAILWSLRPQPRRHHLHERPRGQRSGHRLYAIARRPGWHGRSGPIGLRRRILRSPGRRRHRHRLWLSPPLVKTWGEVPTCQYRAI